MESKTLQHKAKPRGRFPHIKKVENFLFISGTSSRRIDDSIDGVEMDAFGQKTLSIERQAHAVIQNIQDILKSFHASLDHLVDITVFLVKMEDFDAYNRVYAEYFDENGPTRTTIAVKELPHPDLLIEIKATAYIKIEA